MYRDRLPTGHLGPSLFRPRTVPRATPKVRSFQAGPPGHGYPNWDGLEGVITQREKAVPESSGPMFSLKEAALQLEMPEHLVVTLRAKGFFKTNQPLARATWLNQVDISDLARRLLDLAPSSTFSSAENQFLTLGSTLAWEETSTETRALLLQTILAKKIKVEGRINGQISGLLIRKEAYRQFLSSICDQANAKTASEAAKFIDCAQAAIPGLVRMGILRSSMRSQSWLIDQESLESFRREFVFILAVAKMEGTTSKRLIRLCWRNLIGMRCPRSERESGRQPFIRLRDVPALQYALRIMPRKTIGKIVLR
jgi:hypothetical protein